MNIRKGRLGKSMTDDAAEFTSSLEFDKYLFEADIKCNFAHTLMLKEEKIIDEKIADKILGALIQLEEEGYESLEFDHSVEDIHMAVENYVTDLIGSDAGFMHTAKSRNDQVATDIRLALRKKVLELEKAILEFIKELLDLASEHTETIFVGYTHLQHAQPLTFGHHLMAYAQSLKRDYQRLKDTYKRINLNPLGSAAMATTTFPINRELTTKLLGFDEYLENSMDGVSARDFIGETVFDLSMLSSNLSKMAEEMILWSSYEFRLVEIGDDFSSTSSIMPQKKNPDVAEIARAKSTIASGELFTILSILKAIPFTYNRDLQEITPHLWNAYENTYDVLKIMTSMISSIKFNKERALYLANRNFATATDLADLIVKEKSIPFRIAHKIVGRVVSEAIGGDVDIKDIDTEFIDKIAEELDIDNLGLDDDLIQNALDPVLNVKLRKVPGGPAPEMVKIAIKHLNDFISDELSNE
ncbi:argininosuccinate lyase [Methanobrevibacter curvatus]|uniref:argininosuccinate lyase n=1 Tax=Methanobrevibacter curvatus TaxID=49547 RepID=UPI00082DF70E|nr:argininosuccinate lyase [Methanobrevibacter curvatus]